MYKWIHIYALCRSADGFYSDSDSDSDHDERDRKIHVEIKPLNNGSAPISASVDELRATVENLSLSPLGGALSVRNLFRLFRCEIFHVKIKKIGRTVVKNTGSVYDSDIDQYNNNWINDRITLIGFLVNW